MIPKNLTNFLSIRLQIVLCAWPYTIFCYIIQIPMNVDMTMVAVVRFVPILKEALNVLVRMAISQIVMDLLVQVLHLICVFVKPHMCGWRVKHGSQYTQGRYKDQLVCLALSENQKVQQRSLCPRNKISIPYIALQSYYPK